MDISKIIVKRGAKCKTPKRLGRGSGSGWGKTSGRGNKGAGSRSGKVLPYIGFSGGNIPYARKLPKRGFHSVKPIDYQLVNLGAIEAKLKGVAVISPKVLEEAGFIKDATRRVKILGKIDKSFSLKANFTADKFSAAAVKLIEGAGGKAAPREKEK